LNNEELHNFYSPPSIITVIKSKRIRSMCIATKDEKRIHILVGTPERKRSLGRPR